jgi:hypothetical protein
MSFLRSSSSQFYEINNMIPYQILFYIIAPFNQNNQDHFKIKFASTILKNSDD